MAILWAKQITHPEKIFCNPWSYILSHPLKILSSYPILIGNVQNGIFAVIRLFWVRKNTEKPAIPCSGCPTFGESEIQGPFREFQGPFSVNSRS